MGLARAALAEFRMEAVTLPDSHDTKHPPFTSQPPTADFFWKDPSFRSPHTSSDLEISLPALPAEKSLSLPPPVVLATRSLSFFRRSASFLSFPKLFLSSPGGLPTFGLRVYGAL